MQSSQNLENKNSLNNEEMIEEKSVEYNTNANDYNEASENKIENDSREAYYACTQENSGNYIENPYISANMGNTGNPSDSSVMQAIAAINQSMLYQNQPYNTPYSQFSMFDGINSNFANMPSLYGGNMQMPMNPYYDPYGIINPLSSAILNVDKPKKKVKKFFCC